MASHLWLNPHGQGIGLGSRLFYIQTTFHRLTITVFAVLQLVVMLMDFHIAQAMKTHGLGIKPTLDMVRAWTLIVHYSSKVFR